MVNLLQHVCGRVPCCPQPTASPPQPAVLSQGGGTLPHREGVQPASTFCLASTSQLGCPDIKLGFFRRKTPKIFENGVKNGQKSGIFGFFLGGEGFSRRECQPSWTWAVSGFFGVPAGSRSQTAGPPRISTGGPASTFFHLGCGTAGESLRKPLFRTQQSPSPPGFFPDQHLSPSLFCWTLTEVFKISQRPIPPCFFTPPRNLGPLAPKVTGSLRNI